MESFTYKNCLSLLIQISAVIFDVVADQHSLDLVFGLD